MTPLKTYNRISVGSRIKEKRICRNITQEEFAEKIGRAYKYCQDIERGSCGMSIETMLAIASVLDLSLDYLILGNGSQDVPFTNKEYVSKEMVSDTQTFSDILIEYQPIIELLSPCTPEIRLYMLDLLKIFAKTYLDSIH